MSPKKKCAGCCRILEKNIASMQCGQCKDNYHTVRVNIDDEKFSMLTKEWKANWTCPVCVCRKPRTRDNTNTPVRSGSSGGVTASGATVTPITYITDELAASPASYENITRRTKVVATKSNRSPSPDISHENTVEAEAIGSSAAYVTENRLREILRQEISHVLKTTIRDLVSEEFSSIKQEISNFNDSLNFFNSCIENIKKEMEEKTATIKNLLTENASLQYTVSDLSNRMGTLEQVLRESNVEINGIPERKSENLVNIITQVAKSADHELLVEDILHVTRVAKLNPKTDRARTVVVKLRSLRCRDALLAAVATYNKRNPTNKLSTSHLGFEGPSTPVFVAEHLSTSNKSLHTAARKKKRELGYKYVWVRNGRIYMRKDDFRIFGIWTV
ncbi:unnamed protein product [Parnassius mnemosyne]|uniref:FP protein C-terminal domain-containing protein n=1 Tax=Parnassius mnemosyne TaxID=213953 RepID=A0AAV1LI73_9NEOP